MAALVLTGTFKLGNDDTDEADHADEIITFKLSAKTDVIEVPATMTTPTHGRGGSVDWSVTIGYLSNDIAGTVFSLLYDALAGDGVCYFEGKTRASSIGADNPQYAGSFVVTEASLGGAAEALSQGSATFPMTGAPARTTS